MSDKDHLAERDLNAEVAEKVMGLTVVRNKKGGWSIGEADWQDFSGDMQLMNPLPDYCNDIAAAMEVFEKLRNSHEWCYLKISSDYNYCWDLSLTPAATFRTALEEHLHVPTVLVNGYDSLPLAICHLALKAAKWLEEKEANEKETV